MIELKNISYQYNSNDAAANAALDNINITVNDGEFIGIAGHTGSGKTTVAQIMAGLILPATGEITVDNRTFHDAKEAARALRSQVGIVFQYPEHQLFEETVYRDIAFGPKNKGMTEAEIDECVRKSAETVGLSESFFDKSPFELSGGQKRRVAIAGVLATNPSVLILDEPAAGLDPVGRSELLAQLRRIHREKGTTVVLISHSMEDLAENAQRIIVLNRGKKLMDSSAADIFSNGELLKKSGLDLPEITKIIYLLRGNGVNIDSRIFTAADAAAAITEVLGVKKC